MNVKLFTVALGALVCLAFASGTPAQAFSFKDAAKKAAATAKAVVMAPVHFVMDVVQAATHSAADAADKVKAAAK